MENKNYTKLRIHIYIGDYVMCALSAVSILPVMRNAARILNYSPVFMLSEQVEGLPLVGNVIVATVNAFLYVYLRDIVHVF